MTTAATLSLAEALLNTGQLSRNRHFDALSGPDGRKALRLARRIQALTNVLTDPHCHYEVRRQGNRIAVHWKTPSCQGESHFDQSELPLLALVAPVPIATPSV